MKHWGINALNHGSSIAVIGNQIQLFEFSKNDELDERLIQDAFRCGDPERIFWYERPWVKKARQFYAGQYSTAFDMSVIPSRYLKKIGLGHVPITYTPHHASHAAAGYYTSPFYEAAVVVLDAIGEFECASIWHGQGTKLKKVWSAKYPNSLGLFYSAFTKLIGYMPILEEHLLQQKSDKGDPNRYYHDVREYFSDMVKLDHNLHRGVYDWPHPVNGDQDICDIAAAVQKVFEEQVSMVMEYAHFVTKCTDLVYMGGCAMNSKANRLIRPKWNNVWSLKNPGDPSSAIGAVLYHTKQKITSEPQGFRT